METKSELLKIKLDDKIIKKAFYCKFQQASFSTTTACMSKAHHWSFV
jgi:hypothetical protein